VPVGLGEPIYDKLDADIAFAMMGINAVKGWKSAPVFNRLHSVVLCMAMKSHRKVLSVTMLAEFWVASLPGKILRCR
jgi:chorismate synthase